MHVQTVVWIVDSPKDTDSVVFEFNLDDFRIHHSRILRSSGNDKQREEQKFVDAHANSQHAISIETSTPCCELRYYRMEGQGRIA